MRIEEFSLDACRSATSAVYIEDCCISGTEFASVIEKHLADPGEDNLVHFRVRFGVLANGGESQVNKLLASKNLANARLDCSNAIRIESLTPQGLEALGNDRFCCPHRKHCLKPKDYISQEFFSETKSWWGHTRPSQQAHSARKILERIGAQLYQNHLDRVGHQHSKEWIQQSGLGAGGLALTIALGRSVPKSSLPVIWGSGRVKIGGSQIDWVPLLEC